MAQPLNPLHLPVRTESGRVLGLVVDVVIEPDTQSVVAYHVKSSRLLPDIVVAPLIINRAQVISIGPDSMIVDDATLKATHNSTAPQALA
jgi:uncharacterized protein YrrD